MKKYRVLLVGCGQLGTRHLQAVASLNNVGEIHIVDPDNKSLELGKSRLAEIGDISHNIKFSWFNELDKNSANGDLCIVATQAKVRCGLVKQVAQKLHYKNFLIEKIVSQSVGEYKDLMDFCKLKNISVWVNLKARAYSINRYIKSRLEPHETIIFCVIAGNHGLANNGIHEADLFVFYDGAIQIKSFGSQIDPILHSSKRGADIYDFSGTLYGNSNKGSKCIISFAKDYTTPGHISISSPSCRFIIDYYQKFAYESYPATDWSWRNIPIDEDWSVSHMSKKFVSDILMKENCELPTLFESFPAHEFILGELLPYCNSLLGKNDDYCPIT